VYCSVGVVGHSCILAVIERSIPEAEQSILVEMVIVFKDKHEFDLGCKYKFKWVINYKEINYMQVLSPSLVFLI
jgi:hypothetical protein